MTYLAPFAVSISIRYGSGVGCTAYQTSIRTKAARHTNTNKAVLIIARFGGLRFLQSDTTVNHTLNMGFSWLKLQGCRVPLKSVGVLALKCFNVSPEFIDFRSQVFEKDSHNFLEATHPNHGDCDNRSADYRLLEYIHLLTAF